MPRKSEFLCRVPAALANDRSLSPLARVLYLILAVRAGARTGVTYVGLPPSSARLGAPRAKA